MELLQFVNLLIPFIGALLLAIAVVLWFLGAGRAAAFVSAQAQLSFLFVAIVLLSAVQVAFSGRVLTIDPDLLPDLQRTTAVYVWSGRIVTLIALTIGLTYILRWVVRDVSLGAVAPLWLVAMLAMLFGTVVNAAFGTVPGYSYQSSYVPIVLTGIALMPAIDPRRFGAWVKWALLLVFTATAAVAAIKTDLVVENGYRASVVGLSYRLHGLTGHANALGLLAVLALLLERLSPSRRWLQSLTIGLPLAMLALTQSKTQWAGAVICGGVLIGYYFLPGVLKQRAGLHDSFRQPALIVIAVAVLLAAAIAIVMTTQLADKAAVLLSDRYLGLLTFTGRTLIWDITLDEWLRNPMFGYGPTIWGPEFRLRYGLLNVGQAHNQFVQSLGEAGVLGLVSLLAYLGVLAVYAWRARYDTRMVSVALFSLLLVRCFAEAPFRIGSLLDAGVLAHMLLFVLVVSSAKRTVPQWPADAKQRPAAVHATLRRAGAAPT